MRDIQTIFDAEKLTGDLALSFPVREIAPNLALRLRQDGDGVTIPHIPAFEALTEFTFEFGITLLDYGPNPNTNREIIRKFTTGADRMFFFHFQPLDSNNNQFVYSHGDGAAVHQVAIGILPLGTRVHIAVTRSGDNFSIYTAGEFVRIIEFSGAVLDNSSSLGVRYHDGLGPEFVIDQLRVWNVERTETQIAQFSELRPPANEPGLIGYYPFDEGQGNIAGDLSASANDGAISGGDWVAGSPSLIGPPQPAVGGDLATETGLQTSIINSLFTDARARDDDELPPGETDPRGWWGDSLAEVEGDRFGSRLWLLMRRKQTTETLNEAREMVQEALAWLVEDGVAVSVEVEAEWVRRGLLGLRIVVHLTNGAAERFEFDVPQGGA